MTDAIHSLGTILLVEDDRFISRAYQDGLARAGFSVVPVMVGGEAIGQMKKLKPVLVLLDIILPDKDGFEILAEMKLDPQLKNIPVMILSNLGQATDLEKAKTLGVDEYLVKSNTSMKEVVEKIKFFLAKKT